MSNTYEIPYWNKYTLSIEEVAGYFRIGECKLRKIITENPTVDFILWNGNRMQIKRKKFEKFIDRQRGAKGWRRDWVISDFCCFF